MASTKNTTPKKSRPIWKDILVATGIFILIFIGFGFAATLEGDTTPIKNVANQLRVDSKWKLVSERVDGPRMVCLGDAPCPSLHRVWDAGALIKPEEFKKLVKDSGWNLLVKDQCNKETSIDKAVLYCTAQGTVDGYSVSLWVSKSQKTSNAHGIVLSIDMLRKS